MGCNSNCLINCDNITADQCVQYTGPDVPAFGICQGDQLSVVEQVLLDQLQSALIGTGITPADVTLDDCQWLKDLFIGQDSNLSTLLQLLIDSSCTLKEMVDSINTTLASQGQYSFNTLCLQDLPENPTSNDILQATINLLCSLNTTVAAIPATYVRSSDLSTLVQAQITQYFANVQTGQIDYYNYLPLKAALPYFGDLSNFDNTGKGLAAMGMTNIFLCNGLNGTPDLRGMTIVGAVRNVPGGTINPIVDPTSPNNPNWALNDIGGENKHLDVINEMPSHTHIVVDPGHTHNLSMKNGQFATAGGGTLLASLGSDPLPTPVTLANAAVLHTTGITLQSSGGNQPHNNIQPSFAAYYIIRML